MNTELRDLPECPVCHFRHDGVCDEPGWPPRVKFLGRRVNGQKLWVVDGAWRETRRLKPRDGGRK